ncbi:hypothetical protein BUALT_Bualt11G0089500 [Buddleja alternifolia]|uniref:Uncharacterized protein n=1 Tax=Buddleja alternifolia TaxID=168488 RepID=A0AAV6WTM6_9LAMI|nr:hypothetical protein BUALT_Bualt11G0089500 [Buddleja alternifolia]
MAAAASTSAAAAESSPHNDSNRAADEIPPLAPALPLPWPNPQPPQPPLPPPPAPHAVYVEQLYLEPPPPPRRRELTFLCRTIFCGLLIFLFASTFSVLMWLIFHPIFPGINVASAALSTLTSTGTAVTAACNLTLLLTNPNRHLTTIYDRMEISLLYPSKDVLLSQDYPPPFRQPKKSRTTLETNLSFNGVKLGNETVNAIKQDLDRGSLSFGVKILAIVRYRNGRWKTRSQFLRAYCGGVSFGFTSIDKPGIFLNPYQDYTGFFRALTIEEMVKFSLAIPTSFLYLLLRTWHLESGCSNLFDNGLVFKARFGDEFFATGLWKDRQVIDIRAYNHANSWFILILVLIDSLLQIEHQ